MSNPQEVPQKTHYRKAFNSPYLSSPDIVGPTVLTISHVRLEPDKTKKTKDLFNTAYFIEKELRAGEKLKPMILNATNSRTMRQLTGSYFLEDWINVPVTVFVDPSVRFGNKTLEGLRISTEAPKLSKRSFNAQDPALLSRAVAAFERDGNFRAIEEHLSLTEADKSVIREVSNVS